jgi:TRAP-type C4-dicarboxylate transport system substrate-binding protein
MKLKNIILSSAIGIALIATEVHAATEWNVSVWGKRRAFTENVEKLAELIDNKTNGEFKLNISYGGLSKSRENLDGISFGAFEMAQFCSFYHSDKNPTITVTELPFAKDVSLARSAEIYTKVYQNPIVVKDLARWNATILMPTPMPQYTIVSKSEPLTALSDIKGLRVRGPGGIMGVLGQLGAVKTGVPFSEVRQSMDSGVIDAATFAPHAHVATKTYKVGKWASTNLNLGSANCPVVVNTEALNALSDSNRQALLGSVDESISYYVDNYNSKATKKYEEAIAEAGLVSVTFSSAQTAELDKMAASVRENWIKKYADQFDSKALYDFTEDLFNQ